MKFHDFLILGAISASILHAEDVPEAIDFLPKGELVKGAAIAVVPPPELEKYVIMVEEAAKKDPEWFAEYSKNSKPGVPLGYDPKLGLTKEQYDDYLAIWAKREFKAVEPLVLQLKENKDGKWIINAVSTQGGANPIATLRYDPKEDVFISPNGELKRLEDVDADKNSILGAWQGHEWKFTETNTFGETKENFAIGKTADGVYGMLVYRLQETNTDGATTYDKSLVIRFPMGKAGIITVPQR